MVKLLQIIVIALLALNISPNAQAQVKDSFYFMKDDGIFSDEEKDEEAEYIHQQCTKNIFKNVYYDCTCIAGAFRVQRDEEKLIPQSKILENLVSKKNTQCINTAAIAGDAYKFCYDYVKIFRSRDKNNEQYCGCVANKTAHSFKENPVLRTRNIEKIRSKAMLSCNRGH